jgi:uncharacterized protein (TIGR02466 family)
MNDLELIELFPTAIYKSSLPEHINSVRSASLDAQIVEQSKHELYPVVMSADITYDERVYDFAKHIIQKAFEILVDQGYDMAGKQTVFEGMWMQEHHKHSGMEQHIHNNGTQLVGFYFLDVPENSSHLTLHDPRYGKTQLDMIEKDSSVPSHATSLVHFIPKAGELYFTNAWLPHSFSRHGSDEPIRFVHINISVKNAEQQACDLPTVI